MSKSILVRTEQRSQIIAQPETKRLLVGGRGPAGADGNVNSPDGSVSHIVSMTQAEYDLITPDPETIYCIYPEE